jgi:Ca-activated chloride channel family protein
MLLALVLVPLVLLGYFLLERRKARYAVRFTNLELLAAVAGSSRAWRRFVPLALFLLALALALAGLARPQVRTSVASENASIVLALDSSGSMFAEDVKPTRLGAARDAVKRFLKKLPKQYRVAAVAFSGEPQVIAPFTHDRELVSQSLDYLFPGRGTAIGDALARSVELIREDTALADDDGNGSDSKAKRPPSAIILLSDGHQTRGVLQPLQGAARATSYGIPVYTIALGTPDGTITFDRGPFERTIPVPPDPATLRRIAAATKGKFYEVRNAGRLNTVYETLGSRLGRKKAKREATYAFLGGAALLLLVSGLLSTRLQRLP